VRTREHLRRRSIADELRRVSPTRADYPANVLFATRMNGHLPARFEKSFSAVTERNDLHAEGAQWVPQHVLEEVLRARAVSLPSAVPAALSKARAAAPEGWRPMGSA